MPKVRAARLDWALRMFTSCLRGRVRRACVYTNVMLCAGRLAKIDRVKD